MNSRQQTRRRTFGWQRSAIDPVQHNRRVAVHKSFRLMRRELRALNRAFSRATLAAKAFNEAAGIR